MDHRQNLVSRAMALTLVVAMPLLALAGTASARTAKNAAAACVKHPGRTKCKTGGGGAGTGGAPAPLVVSVQPNPLVETGPSEIHAVIQIEAALAFADAQVTVSSQQLINDCGTNTVQYVTNAGGGGRPPGFFSDTITLTLDNDGNATVALYAADCAPGSSLIEVDLEKAPYYTATATLVALPPQVTTPGLTGFPNNEVETGDTYGIPSPSGNSDVYAVFYVETDPVYAEDQVTITSPQLEARCGQGYWFQGGNGGSVTISSTGTVQNAGPGSQLDNDGNAVFIFIGASCAPGDSVVTADVEGGTHQTYSMVYTILAPAPTDI
jgi:hypothetical protein